MAELGRLVWLVSRVLSFLWLASLPSETRISSLQIARPQLSRPVRSALALTGETARANKLDEVFKQLASFENESTGSDHDKRSPSPEHNSILIGPEELLDSSSASALGQPEMMKNNHNQSQEAREVVRTNLHSGSPFGQAHHSRHYGLQQPQPQHNHYQHHYAQQVAQHKPAVHSNYFAPSHYSAYSSTSSLANQHQQQQSVPKKYQLHYQLAGLGYAQALHAHQSQAAHAPKATPPTIGHLFNADHSGLAHSLPAHLAPSAGYSSQQQDQQQQQSSSNQLLSGYVSASSALSAPRLRQQLQAALDSSNSIDIDAPELNDTEPVAESCGRQRAAPVREPRIVGGNNTYEGEFPWAVSIQRHGNHHCGGVIIARRWILTAAHCVRSQFVANLVVRTGGHTLQRSAIQLSGQSSGGGASSSLAASSQSPSSSATPAVATTNSQLALGRDYAVDQIIMHDDFNRLDNLQPTSNSINSIQYSASGSNMMKSAANTANNADIALLRLRSDILLNELAWPVCFPSRESGNFSGHDAVVIGWGKLNEKSEEFSNELQKVKLSIIDNKVCQNWFRQAGREMPIDERIICAGFKQGGKDACHGDSGGPLLSRMASGQYAVVGVVSTGIGCARPLLPGLYSRVSSYLAWIEGHIQSAPAARS